MNIVLIRDYLYKYRIIYISIINTRIFIKLKLIPDYFYGRRINKGFFITMELILDSI